jgi:hypothetical protein
VDCGRQYIDEKTTHDEVNFYATMFFRKYLIGGQWSSFSLGPEHPGADPNITFEAWLP